MHRGLLGICAAEFGNWRAHQRQISRCAAAALGEAQAKAASDSAAVPTSALASSTTPAPSKTSALKRAQAIRATAVRKPRSATNGAWCCAASAALARTSFSPTSAKPRSPRRATASATSASFEQRMSVCSIESPFRCQPGHSRVVQIEIKKHGDSRPSPVRDRWKFVAKAQRGCRQPFFRRRGGLRALPRP
ncbi:hypothetical protein T492DRAFT_841131 [Pavlovales sp. CCMP2436]|nr:hypothetical protein T492DRAFT_841131 [Pavlovales sp. CCMP2436]